MNILYLSEDYMASKVHHELVSRLAKFGHKITVYSVVRLIDIESDIRETYGPVDYRVCTYSLKPSLEIPYRFFWGIKKRLKYSNLIKQLNPKEVEFVHAATLFSEGLIAYHLFKKYNIPYSVAVRGTDIELYLSKMPHLWIIGKRILENASRIVFISPIIREKFRSKKPIVKLYSLIRHKCVIIPNGIEDFWIKNRQTRPFTNNARNILYIGRFDDNKNVERLVKATLELSKTFPDLKLNFVGGGGVCHKDIITYCNKYPQTLTYLGKIYDKEQLLKIIRDNQIFAMVSHSETFGLVYLEALSQGLPILYTAGQGIDTSVPDYVGEKAISTDQDNITENLNRLIENYHSYRQLGDGIMDFSWDNVAEKYAQIFNQSI